MLFSLRSYLHYHIKCCKGYMHTRMRYRVDELLKVLCVCPLSAPPA